MRSPGTIRRFAITVAVMLPAWLATACQAFRHPVSMDIRPHQPPVKRVALHQSAGSCARGSAASTVEARNTILLMRDTATEISIVAGSTLTEGRSTQLMDNQDLLNRLTSVQRTAQKLIDDDGSDPAGIASKGAALITALIDAGYGVRRFSERADLQQAQRQSLGRLDGWLGAQSAVVSTALLPTRGVAAHASTPGRKAALAALDLVRMTRADESLVGSRPHISLAAGIDSVERAAQAFVQGCDEDRPGAGMQRAALATTILLTERVATNIAARNYEPEVTRTRAADLAGSLRAILAQMGVQPPAPEEQSRNAAGWLWWEEVPGIVWLR